VSDIDLASLASPDVLARARKIKLFLMDVDGTLTDGGVCLISTTAADGSGDPIVSEMKVFNARWTGTDARPHDGDPDRFHASPRAIGERPYWPDAVLKRHIRPAAERAGITKTIGWHSFQRTLATLLHSSGASVKTTQDLLRHSSPMMTLGVYAKAVTADKRAAQDAIAAMMIGKETKSGSE
jgi:hypothetical protein